MSLPLFATFALCVLTIASNVVEAASPSQPPRWVSADDVRVRQRPDPESKVIGGLPRGAELILKTTAEFDGYCLIEGEGRYGYVSCQYLSDKPVARRKAGMDGIDPTQRWITGNAVTLRDEPRPDAAVLSRLALNAVVILKRELPDSGYCDVQLSTGQSGFTACRYLADTPIVLAHIKGYRRADEEASPDYDPVRAFWLEPSWYALEAYAEHLKRLNPDLPPTGPWPPNEALNSMKAHLELGLLGRKPEPYPEWAELKSKAAQDLESRGEAKRLAKQGKKVSEEMWRREAQTRSVASDLQMAIHIWGQLHDPISGDRGAERVIGLIRALNFAEAAPSLFRDESEIAPPGVAAEKASGRFGIIFRQVVSSRPKGASDLENYSGAGLYDMLARTQLLVRPVTRVQLYRDGRLRTEQSLLRQKEILWRDADEPMCSGWVPGFSFGAADKVIWNYFSTDAAHQAKLNRNPEGSLYAFYTKVELPLRKAQRKETQAKFDRNATGFVRGSYLYYDMNDDSIPDLAIWEGEGKGPGHLEDSTTTDDRWFRLALVNVNGVWKVLGSDVFGYGCGC